jgi:hypothetical protein
MKKRARADGFASPLRQHGQQKRGRETLKPHFRTRTKQNRHFEPKSGCPFRHNKYDKLKPAQTHCSRQPAKAALFAKFEKMKMHSKIGAHEVRGLQRTTCGAGHHRPQLQRRRQLRLSCFGAAIATLGI